MQRSEPLKDVCTSFEAFTFRADVMRLALGKDFRKDAEADCYGASHSQ